MNQIRKQETKYIYDNRVYKKTKTWLENQRRVYSVDVFCHYCNKSYHAHDNNFKKHITTNKHINNESIADHLEEVRDMAE